MCKKTDTNDRWDNVAHDFLPKTTRKDRRKKKTKLVLNADCGMVYGTLDGDGGNGGINLVVHSSPAHETGETIPFEGNTPTRRIDAFPVLAKV